MKSYTDLEQSKKLAKILPLESADMFYVAGKGEPIFIGNKMVSCGEDDYDALGGPDVLCWSLTALLDVLPVIIGDVLSKNSLRLRIDKSETDFNVWYDNLDSGMVEESLDIIKSNAVDACYEVIIKLYELKML